MNRFLLLLALVLPLAAQANIFSVRVDASVTNIGTSFADSSASRVIQGVRNVRGLIAWSTTTAPIVINCSYPATVVPSDTDSHNVYLPGGGTIAIDDVGLDGTCYIRSDASGVTVGKLYLMLKGDQ